MAPLLALRSLLLAAATAAGAAGPPSLPRWVAAPAAVLGLLGLAGLFYSIRGVIRLYDPPANAFELPASQPVFRFVLTQPGAYELACTRPGQYNRYFDPPTVTLEVRPWPAGPAQLIRAGGPSLLKRTNLSGDTTQRLGSFVAAAPGKYELRNPGAAQFGPGDCLRILPATGAWGLLFILAILVSAFATLGGLLVGLLAGLGRG